MIVLVAGGQSRSFAGESRTARGHWPAGSWSKFRCSECVKRTVPLDTFPDQFFVSKGFHAVFGEVLLQTVDDAG